MELSSAVRLQHEMRIGPDDGTLDSGDQTETAGAISACNSAVGRVGKRASVGTEMTNGGIGSWIGLDRH